MKRDELELVKKSTILQRIAKKKQIPFSAAFDVTFRCNSKCVHCCADFPHHGKELSSKEAISALEQLADLGVLYINFGGGEPFIRKDFIDIISHARRLGFVVSMTTNATLIDKDRADKLVDLFPRQIKISLYGATERAYGKITGNPHLFKKTIQGIRLLAERDIHLLVVLQIFNFNTVKDILAMKKICQDFGVAWKITRGLSYRMNGDSAPFNYALSVSQLVEFAEKIPEISFVEFAANRRDNGLVCDVRGQIYINPYGQVGNCPMLHAKSSIREKPILDIWKNDLLLKKQRKKLVWKDFPDCLKCEDRPYCSLCPAVNFSVTGSFTSPPSDYCKQAHIEKQTREILYSKRGS